MIVPGGIADLPSSVVTAISTAGHPTAGTWATDQAVIDTNGIVWTCTAGGKPGTWIEGSSGGSSTLAGLSDVALDSPSAGQGLVYNTSTSKWDNGYASAENVNTVASAGSAQTIPDPWISPFETLSDITYSANCTFTFPAAAEGKSFTLMLRQPASGGPYTPTFPTVTWLGGGVQQSTAASTVDVATFICTDGTNWIGAYTPEQVATSGWTNISSFSNGWSNYGSGFTPMRYRLDPNGYVHMEGLVANGTSGLQVFVLPAGYRPGYERWLAEGSVIVNTNGSVTAGYAAAGSYQWIGDIFLAEN